MRFAGDVGAAALTATAIHDSPLTATAVLPGATALPPPWTVTAYACDPKAACCTDWAWLF